MTPRRAGALVLSAVLSAAAPSFAFAEAAQKKFRLREGVVGVLRFNHVVLQKIIANEDGPAPGILPSQKPGDEPVAVDCSVKKAYPANGDGASPYAGKLTPAALEIKDFRSSQSASFALTFADGSSLASSDPETTEPYVEHVSNSTGEMLFAALASVNRGILAGFSLMGSERGALYLRGEGVDAPSKTLIFSLTCRVVQS